MSQATSLLRARHWLLPAGVAVLAVLLQATNQAAELRLEAAALAGQPWRLATAHLVHLGWTHLAMNLAALAILWALLGTAMPPWQWALVLATSGAGVSLGLLRCSPEVAWYVGLSGVLHGMLAAGALAMLRRQRGISLALLALLLGKLVAERLTHGAGATAALIGGPVIVAAHLYGALAGLLCGGLVALAARRA
jgi:rhomboid family GlyGly-CTERM serine protease